MELSNFYHFRTEDKAYGLVVTNWEIDSSSYIRGEAEVGEPIVFRYHMGGRLYDIIEGSFYPLRLLSERVINAFRAHNLTGWKTYPVEVYDKKKNLVPGYALFGITGRAGPMDRKTGERVVVKSRLNPANLEQVRRGMHFDPNTWDGQDFFILDDSRYVMATARVKAALASLKLKNIALIPMLEYEIPESVIRLKVS